MLHLFVIDYKYSFLIPCVLIIFRPPPLKKCTYVTCKLNEQLCGTSCYDPKVQVSEIMLFVYPMLLHDFQSSQIFSAGHFLVAYFLAKSQYCCL